MQSGDPVEDEHLLLRRFDPGHAIESYRDEGTGISHPTANAFTFDTEEPERRGLSVYDDTVLEQATLERRAILDQRWSAVAGAAAATLRAIVRPGENPDEPGPYDPRHDPFPDGDTRPVQEAHCLVWRPEPIGAHRRKLQEQFVAAFSPLPLTRDV